MPAHLNIVPTPTTKPQKATHTRVDTILITPEKVNDWKDPPFQRPLRTNAKVMALAEQLREDGGVIPGVITLGVLNNKETYLLDGQHRRAAFLIAELEEGYADVRYHFFNSMADMGEEFVNINTQLVRLRPDDVLRGLEGSVEGIQLIRQRCPFVGYDQIRRGDNKGPMVSMSALLRCWFGSQPDVPTTSSESAASLAKRLTVEDGVGCTDFLKVAEQAWGRDPQYGRLWGNLNLIICMWLWRRLVLTQYSARVPKLSRELFKKCLMSLSADEDYLSWLVGRNIGERDRSPAYARIKKLFARRLEVEMGKKPVLPNPAWERGHV